MSWGLASSICWAISANSDRVCSSMLRPPKDRPLFNQQIQPTEDGEQRMKAPDAADELKGEPSQSPSVSQLQKGHKFSRAAEHGQGAISQLIAIGPDKDGAFSHSG